MDFNWTVHFWRPKIQMRLQNAFGLHNVYINAAGRLNIQMRLQNYISPSDKFVSFAVQLDGAK